MRGSTVVCRPYIGKSSKFTILTNILGMQLKRLLGLARSVALTKPKACQSLNIYCQTLDLLAFGVLKNDLNLT